ncbi:hypothetical protein Pan153_55550 [Gimesia panareensis]|uniref:ACT domain-containing protein n=1 Tax=Gimesia panareensis TaxID=2527978 RepID=A0A518FX91_9PLAN|nr:hypothetical protein [Gimesia panareensis]QDV20876.1 hypothetical protein Pan153_55550 [Gimesia panareensis]
MNKSRVWVRALSDSCRVSVDNIGNAALVLDSLSQIEALKGLTSVTLIVELKDDLMPSASKCSFIVPGSSNRTLQTLENALRQMPNVELMLEPDH